MSEEPPNAFSPAFLDLVAKSTWPEYPVSLEAGRWDGPWIAEPDDQTNRWHVRQLGVSQVMAALELHETALMLAAILPIVFQPPTYGLKDIEDRGKGFSSMLMTTLGDRGYTAIGNLRTSDENILGPLHVAHGLLTRPSSLAFILRAAPPEVLAHAGELVARSFQKNQP